MAALPPVTAVLALGHMGARMLRRAMAGAAWAGLVAGAGAQSDYYSPLTFSTLAGAAGQAGAVDGQGSAARFAGPRGLASDNIDGCVYVADTGNNTIRKISSQGVTSTFAGTAGVAGSSDGTGAAALFSSPCGIAINIEEAANIYVADSGNNTIRVITPAGAVTTLAGMPGAAGSADGTGGAALFNNPSGIAMDLPGNLYVADTGNHTIRKITPSGVVTTLAGTPGSAGSSDGTGAAARFSSPRGVAVDFSGNVYVADTGNNTIRMITSAGVVTTLAGAAGVSGSVDGAGNTARFSAPGGIVIDSYGNAYVADTGNDTIRAFSAQPGPVVVITLGGIAGFAGSSDGSGSAAQFSAPESIGLSWNGAVFVADTGNGTIRTVASPPIPINASITPGSGGVLVGGAVSYGVHSSGTLPSVQWQLNGVDIPGATNPWWTIDSAQPSDAGIYTAVLSNGTTVVAAPSVALAVHSPVTFAPSTVASNITGGPNGVACDGNGDIYITAGNALELISPTGAPVLIAGSLTGAGSADGVGGAAKFNAPTGIAVDGAGNIYVADSGNNSIRKVSPLGSVTTLAGQVQGSADGIGAAAQFDNPVAVAVDPSGNVYVADAGNNELREVAPDGTTTTLMNYQQVAYLNSAIPVPYFISSVAVDNSGLPHIALANTMSDPYLGGLEMFIEKYIGQGIANIDIEYGDGYSPTTSGAVAIDGAGNIYSTNNGGISVLAPLYSLNSAVIAPLNDAGVSAVTLAAGPIGTLYVADPQMQSVTALAAVGGFNFPPPAVFPPVNPGSPISYPAASASSGPTWVTGSGNSSGPATPVTSPPSTSTQNGETNGSGNAASSFATSRLANISSRALVGTSANIEIAGFVVSGPTGSTEEVLIRGVGPALKQFGISGVLENPVLTLFDAAGKLVATNTAWSNNVNAPQVAAAMQSTGAFGLPQGSADSALLLGLAPGAYTAQLTGLNGATGVALAEVYETNSGIPRLVNISTRAFVGTGSNVEIAGIDIAGTKPATILIRAVGPTLGQIGVAGALAQPSLSVVDSSGTTVASNTGWSSNANASQIASTAQTVGAFALPSGSADCALLLTLAPGAYTAIVSGVGGTSGVALVEAYEAQ
jgi:sugar lactone lactonase YvrE